MKPIVNDLPYKYSMNKYEPSMRNLDVYLDFHMEYQDRVRESLGMSRAR